MPLSLRTLVLSVHPKTGSVGPAESAEMIARVTVCPVCSGPRDVSVETGTVPGKQGRLLTLELMRTKEGTKQDPRPPAHLRLPPQPNPLT